MAALTDRERAVLLARFGPDADLRPQPALYPCLSLDAIAQVYGVSRERIRLVEQRALAKLGVDTLAVLQDAVRRAIEDGDDGAEPR